MVLLEMFIELRLNGQHVTFSFHINGERSSK